MNQENRAKRILALTTGGTIEKSYCEAEGTIANRESLLKAKLVQRLRLPYTEVTVQEIMAKDSLDMTETDRELISQRLDDSQNAFDGIVVLHGTDTMEQTIRLCHDRLAPTRVPIVFTGAMKPAGFDDTDAVQNVTEAFLAAQFLAPGIYLSFHGRIFPAPRLTKNRRRGTFESTDS